MSPTTTTSCTVTVSCCPLCPEEDNARGEFSDRPVDKAVVKTSCQPEPHTYHLGCITQYLENPVNEKKCRVCSQTPLPLVRADGARFVEDSPYCESSALEICRRGDAQSLERLLADHPEVATARFRSAQTGELVSLLSITASSGHDHCQKILIDKGADDLNGAIEAASCARSYKCLVSLLLGGMSDLLDCYKKVMGHVTTEEPVCEAGVDDTDMLLALRKGDSDGLQAAIERGGQDINRYTLFCALRGHAECMKVLINNGAQVGLSLQVAALFGSIDVMTVLLDTFNQSSGSMYSALFMASLNGNSDCLKLLLERTESIDLYNLAFALEGARHHDQTECVKLLDEVITKSGLREFLDEEKLEADAKVVSAYEIPNSMIAFAKTRNWSCVIS